MRISHEYISRAAQNIGLAPPDGFEMLNSLTGNNRNVLLLPLGHVSVDPLLKFEVPRL